MFSVAVEHNGRLLCYTEHHSYEAARDKAEEHDDVIVAGEITITNEQTGNSISYYDIGYDDGCLVPETL